MTYLGIKNEYDCTCAYCIHHHCVLESDRDGYTIGKCYHVNCEVQYGRN